MDAHIAKVANQQREVARMTLQWELDRLRLYVGMVEVIPRSEDVPLTRYSETTPKESDPARMIPLGNGMCVLVRDVK